MVNQITCITGIVTLLDCLFIPLLLGAFYPNYSHMRMTLSALGGKGSPVRKFYNFWMACLGVYFTAIGIYLFLNYRKLSYLGACLLLIVTLSYAIFDCLLSSIFSTGNSKEMRTLAEKVHDYGSAFGCTVFLFAGLIGAILLGKTNLARGIFLLVCFLISVVLFGLFIAGEDISVPVSRWEKFVAQTGLWQRLSLAMMYLPYIILVFYIEPV